MDNQVNDILWRKMDPDQLKAGIRVFVTAVAPVLNIDDAIPSNCQISEIVFNLAVGAEGRLSLIGSGVAGRIEAGIAVHLKVK